VGQQGRVILKDETANIEGIIAAAPVYVISADMIVLVNYEYPAVSLTGKHRGGHKACNPGSENHCIKSFGQAALTLA
jgi:hypothetical protein